MPLFPIPSTTTLSLAGLQNITAQWVANVRDGILSAHNLPSCVAYCTVPVTLTNNVATTLNFDSERWDTDNMHDVTGVSAPASRIVIKTAGRYRFGAGCGFDNNGTGHRQIVIRKNNGTAGIARSHLPASPSTANHVASCFGWDICAVGDFYDVQVTQTSGVGLLTVAPSTGPEYTFLSAEFVGVA